MFYLYEKVIRTETLLSDPSLTLYFSKEGGIVCLPLSVRSNKGRKTETS